MTLQPVSLDYEEHGEGVPLVLVHGFPLNRTIWYPVLPVLKQHARVILPDLRGYGQSPAGEADVYSMRLLAEDLLALLDKLKIEKVVLAGHSMGGYVSLAFAKAYPQRLAGLALITSNTGADQPEKRQSRLVMAGNIKRRGTAGIAKRIPPTMTEDPVIAKKLAEIIAAGNPPALIASLKGMAEREDANEWVSSIHVPTLVIAGENDKIIPLEKPKTFIQFFPRGWLVEIPGVGHVPQMEAPEATEQALLQLVHRAEVVNIR